MKFGGIIKKVACLSEPVANSERDLMQTITEKICERLQRKKDALILWRIRKNNLQKQYIERRLSLSLIQICEPGYVDVIAIIDNEPESAVWLCTLWDEQIISQDVFEYDKFIINVNFKYL